MDVGLKGNYLRSCQSTASPSAVAPRSTTTGVTVPRMAWSTRRSHARRVSPRHAPPVATPLAIGEMKESHSNAHRRRRHPASRGYFVAALAALGAVIGVLVAGNGDSEAKQRVRLAAQKLDGRIVRVSGTETTDGACIEVRNGGGLSQACGLAAPAGDELTVFEDYGAGLTAFVIYAGNRVSAVRVKMRSGGWKTKPLHRADGAGDMEWFKPLRFGLLVRKGHVAQPKLVALGRDGRPLEP